MKQKHLYVMCGPAGVGKSTWINNRICKYNNGIHISRDKIRFSLLKEDDDYFAYEDEIIRLFYKQIQEAIDNPIGDRDIYIDATHLSPKVRNTLFNHISLENVEKVSAVSFEIPLSVIYERNARRSGRALVPETIIYNMYHSYKVPTFEEWRFNEVIHVDKNSEEIKERKV